MNPLSHLIKPNLTLLQKLDALARKPVYPSPGPILYPTDWQDLRAHPRSHDLSRGRPVKRRKPEDITGFCLHQTASGSLHREHPRLPAIPAHVIIHGCGTITVLNDPEMYMAQAHALNRFTIGIEIDCRIPGLMGDPSTFYRTKKEKAAGLTMRDLMVMPTSLQLESTLEYMRFMQDLYWSRYAIELRRIYSHCQGHRSRIHDCGEGLYRPIMRNSDTLHSGPMLNVADEKYGSGCVIRKEWR